MLPFSYLLTYQEQLAMFTPFSISDIVPIPTPTITNYTGMKERTPTLKKLHHPTIHQLYFNSMSDCKDDCVREVDRGPVFTLISLTQAISQYYCSDNLHLGKLRKCVFIPKWIYPVPIIGVGAVH